MQQKKPLTIKAVLIISSIIGIAIGAMAYFGAYMQQSKTIEASRAGNLPRMKELGGMQQYASDSEGTHFYALEQQNKTPAGNVRVWSKLVYTQDSKNSYIMKRRQRNFFIEGFDHLIQRNVLYEFACNNNPLQYAIIEVFEVDEKGMTLDYGKAGSSRDWGDIPQRTVIEKLAQIVCPSSGKQ